MNKRLENLRTLIAREGLECLIVSQPENRRYISGFTGSAGVLAVSAQEALILADFRYYTQAQEQASDFELCPVGARVEEALARAIREHGWRRIGIEKHDVTLETYEKWHEAAPCVEWALTRGLVESLRQIKDETELAFLEKAVAISDEAMQHLEEWIKPGVTESDVAWELERYMRTHGAEALSFTTIVGSGPNSALPHAVVTERIIQAGDPVVIDMGALYQGYHSDMTRSFCLKHATDEYLKIWQIVLDAQLAVEQRLKANMTGFDVDKIARDLIYNAGYEGKFGHGLGHSVGLAIHENPRASSQSQEVLSSGVVLTVEPGIYLPGVAGVRIEDMVVIQEHGCQVLTQCPKQPILA